MVEVTQVDVDATQEYNRRFPEIRLTEAFAKHRIAGEKQGRIAERERNAGKARKTMIAEMSGLKMEDPYRTGIKWAGERIIDAIRAASDD